MYEGIPLHPQPDRMWRIVEKYKARSPSCEGLRAGVTLLLCASALGGNPTWLCLMQVRTFYTAPTLIRALEAKV